MAPRRLNYASGRAQITREGDGLSVTFPPAQALVDVWISAGTLSLLAALFLAGAVWPAGVTHVGGAGFTHPGGIKGRVLLLAFAAALAAICWSLVRDRLVQSTLEITGRTLTYRRPGLWAFREDQYDLAHYVDVDMVEGEDGETVYLWLRRGDDAPPSALPVEIASRTPSEDAKADLEMVADAVREAVWPERAAARTRKSTFTRIGPDAIASDKGFAVRLPVPGRVEYSRDGKTLSLDVQRGWTDDHAMCFVIDPQALSRWDGPTADQTLPDAVRREILHDLGEALREWGVRVAVGGVEQCE